MGDQLHVAFEKRTACEQPRDEKILVDVMEVDVTLSVGEAESKSRFVISDLRGVDEGLRESVFRWRTKERGEHGAFSLFVGGTQGWYGARVVP